MLPLLNFQAIQLIIEPEAFDPGLTQLKKKAVIPTRISNDSWISDNKSLLVILTYVSLKDTEVYTYLSSQNIKLIDSLKMTRQFLFQQTNYLKREQIDHFKVIQKVKKYSKKMGIKMPMYIIPDADLTPTTIKGKYEVHQELKESTFSNLFIVR